MKVRGFHKKIVLPKSDVFAELKRRVPNIQTHKTTFVNLKNMTTLMLMKKMLDYPITDEGDIAFIKNEFLKWETTFKEVGQTKTPEGRMSFQDKLRFINILANEDAVREAYLRSTDGKNRSGLD